MWIWLHSGGERSPLLMRPRDGGGAAATDSAWIIALADVTREVKGLPLWTMPQGRQGDCRTVE